MFAIESANIVGYQTLDTNTSGATMLAPTFTGVSLDGSCTLADLKVTGYTAPVYNETKKRWSGGTSGAFNLQFLTSAGKTEATYKWYDDGKVTAGWYDGKGNTIDGGAESVIIPAGKAVWCITTGLKLTTAGQVNIKDVVYTTNVSGATAIGNSSPVDITLADLVISGYDAPVYNETKKRWSGGTSGAFNLQFLTTQGKTEATYKWYDDGKVAAGWYDGKGDPIEGGAESVKIPAGKGLWCIGKGLTVRIPSAIAPIAE